MEFILVKGQSQTVEGSTIAPKRVVSRYEKETVWDPNLQKNIVRAVPIYKVVYTIGNLPNSKASTAAEGEEYAILRDYKSLDIEIGGANNFELKIDRDKYNDLGIGFFDYLICDGSEFGGRVETMEINTNDSVVIVGGTTWRGILKQCILAPNAGVDYYTATGELNSVLGTILARGSDAGTLFTASTVSTGVSVSGYRFNRYCTKLYGLEKMLSDNDYKLKIWAESGAPSGTFTLNAEAVAVDVYSQDYSQETTDNNINIKDFKNGTNHLICLGAGQLSSRQRVDLYVDADGVISQSQTFTGIDEKTAVYDDRNVNGNNSTEQLANLEKDGTEKLIELMNNKKMSLTSNEESALIGDYVGGVDDYTGISLLMPVKGKIYRSNGKTEKIELIIGEQEDYVDEDY